MENSLRIYQDIINLLEDDESKDIYLKRLNYLISGDFRYIREIVTAYAPDLIPWNGLTFDMLLSTLPKDRKFILYGAGRDGQKMLANFVHDERFAGFCSKNVKKQETGYLGYPVMSPDSLFERKDLSVLISTSAAKQEIVQLLRNMEYPKDLIFDVPAYLSKKLEDTEQYFCLDFMTFAKDEVFIDAGCCDLNTSLKLRKYAPDVKVYAFEPDPDCYKKCVERKRVTGYNNAKIFPFGTWSKKDSLSFQLEEQGSSYILEKGKTVYKVPVISIDEAVDPNEKVTFIKMDVEGAELESLKGAKEVIRRDKPKLAICIYHRPEDMWTIPSYINELVPDYRLYIRHHSSQQEETVLYAVL